MSRQDDFEEDDFRILFEDDFEGDDFRILFDVAAKAGVDAGSEAMEWCGAAAREGWLDDRTDILVGYGANSGPVWVGVTPLGMAVACGLAPVCERLLELGASGSLGEVEDFSATRVSGLFVAPDRVSFCMGLVRAGLEKRDLEKGPGVSGTGFAPRGI